MSDTMQAQGPETATPAQATPQDPGKAGSGSLLTGATHETATPGDSAPAAPAQGQEGQGKAQSAQTPLPLPGYAAAATKELKGDEKFAALVSKYKSFDDFAKAHLELESYRGRSVRIPDESASDEEKAAFQAKLDELRGAVAKPEDYVLDQPELPAGLEYDPAVAESYKAISAELRLTKEQAAKLYAWANERTIESFKAEAAKQEEAALVAQADARREVEATVKALRAEWGSAFDAELARTTRLVDEMDAKIPGLKAELDRTGFGNSKSGIMLLHALASQFADHRLVGGDPAVGVVDAASAMFGTSMKA